MVAIELSNDLRLYLEQRIEVDPESGCWLWIGPISDKGYAIVNWKGRKYRGHRVTCALHGKPLPNDKNGCHTCDNTRCVNPEHIFEGTQVENMRDAAEKGRTSRGTKRYNSKITEDAVRAIRVSTEPHTVEAMKYGIDESTVRAIRSYKRWKHTD